MDAQVGSILAVAGRLRMESGYLHMLDLLHGLTAQGCNVALVCGRAPSELAARDITFPVHTWKDASGGWRGTPPAGAIRDVLHHPDRATVHVHGSGLGRSGRAFLRSIRSPVVFTPHSAGHDARELRGIHRRAARVVALSQYLREGLINRARLSRIKISVIPPGLEMHHYAPQPPEVNGRVPAIGAVGPLEHGRGQLDFIHAVRLLLDAGKRAEFVIAGDGPAEQKLRRCVDELRLGNHITFVTRLPDFKGVIAALDLLVRPAVVSGIGYVVLEAMAMSKPVVVTATAGLPELVDDGHTGLIVSKSDPQGLAAAIAQLIDQPARAREMGLAARRRVAEHFNMEKLAADMMKLYAVAAADHKRSRTAP